MIAPAALAVNTWTHLAATFDGAMVRLYVNGALVASQAQTTPLAPMTGTLQIGGNSSANVFFAGRIDEVRIYNRALSAGEIQAEMNVRGERDGERNSEHGSIERRGHAARPPAGDGHWLHCREVRHQCPRSGPTPLPTSPRQPGERAGSGSARPRPRYFDGTVPTQCPGPTPSR